MVYNDTSSNLIINNTINNKPLFYLEEQSNMVITGDFGQIILVQCHNITIKNQEITNTFLGIELIETTHCSLCQNTVESNYMAGILLLKSSNNIITGNTIYANYQGIMAWGDDNMFSNNTITFNNQSGLSLSHCLNTTIVGNVISNNDRGIEGGSYSTYTIKDNTISENAYGLMIYGHTESYNLITDNNIYFNTQCGIKFNNVGNTILLNNSITSNNKGIYADYSENIIFLNNTISYQQTGIILSDSTNNIFSGNIVASNVKGIDFSDSDQNSISGKNFITNNTNGMILWYSNSNIISNNILENNEASGIEFSESSKNIISGNTFFWDHDVLGDNEAINLYDSTDTIISDNTIIKPTLGIVMTDSSYNSIRRNHISECISQAIQCSSGSNNDICGNFLTENGIGINVSYTYNNKIEENVVIHTANTGIDLSWSSDNAINKNNISLNTNGVIIRYSSTHNVLKENVIRGNYETGITLMTDAAFNTIIDNVILKNTLGINSSGYQNIFDNNDISLNTNGVIVGNSSTNNILKENTIGENQKTGIILLTDAAFNTIIDNEILKNTQGITISGNHNTINHNMISENTYGINISYGSNNFICCNNFLANKHQAGFKVLFTHRNNRWNNNYWNQSRILPQPIFGKIGWRNPGFSFPWVSFDWHPARKPYEIL
jgi:parallel beta-helix repeat protein